MAGVATLLWPGVTAVALLYLIAVWAIVRGVFEILAPFHLRRDLTNEWLLALNGALSGSLRTGQPERRRARPRSPPCSNANGIHNGVVCPQ